MARNLSSPFYDGYSFNFGDLEATFVQGADGMWTVRIVASKRDAPLFTTPPTPDRFGAYAQALEWCREWLG